MDNGLLDKDVLTKELLGLVDHSLSPEEQASVILDYLAKLNIVPTLPTKE